MGSLPQHLYDAFLAVSTDYLEQVIPTQEYIGWLAAPSEMPTNIVAGAGLVQRSVSPHPQETPGGVVLAEGRQGIVVNVFTERAWRKRGLARLLMEQVLAWAAENSLETVVLHASPDGRPLYERLGFVATNEMRYRGPLLHREAGE